MSLGSDIIGMVSDLSKYWSTRDMLRQAVPPEAGRSATALMRVLFTNGRMPIPELMTRAELGHETFSASLRLLVDTGLVVLQDEGRMQVAVPSDEVVATP